MSEETWTIQKSSELYDMQGWGEKYFDINSDGQVVVRTNSNDTPGNLYTLVKSLVQRGIEPPILLRFNGIIRERIKALQSAFKDAIDEFHYKNEYQLVFPIKVNPQNHIVDVIQNLGPEDVLGFEVGSKPELIAVLCKAPYQNTLLLCNGYKDAEYIELALLSIKLGRHPIIIVEQYYELKLVLEIAQRLNVEPDIGFRMKLSQQGSGRWRFSGGDLAKFGLNTHEIVQGLEELKKAGKAHWLKLLHFHQGSQVSSILTIKQSLHEAACMYIALAKECPSMCYFDVGGGLGVDYAGSRTISDSSMNYSVEEYARDVVYAIADACKKAKLSPPIIISESGRAIAAHHSVLITEVIDVTLTPGVVAELDPPPSSNETLALLCNLYNQLDATNCQEALHDALELKNDIIQGFISGKLSLTDRSYAEKVYRHLAAKMIQLSQDLKFIPDDLKNLEMSFLDLYFCNFSVFQSLPDSWAIQQVFPVLPIHRLNEEPTRRAIIVDITCDSDGKINHFVSNKEPNYYVNLHDPNNMPYYLGIFLVGAYQEILGGLHNLFGDTNAVHLELDHDGNWTVTNIVEGDNIGDVLQYVQYNTRQLIERLQGTIEKSIKAGQLSMEDSAKLQKKIKEALESYTYLIV